MGCVMCPNKHLPSSKLLVRWLVRKSTGDTVHRLKWLLGFQGCIVLSRQEIGKVTKNLRYLRWRYSPTKAIYIKLMQGKPPPQKYPYKVPYVRFRYLKCSVIKARCVEKNQGLKLAGCTLLEIYVSSGVRADWECLLATFVITPKQS